MSDLKNCPFCGGEALWCHRRNKGATADWCGDVQYWVYCDGDDCGIATPLLQSREEADVVWNRRAGDGTREAIEAEIVAWLREIAAQFPTHPMLCFVGDAFGDDGNRLCAELADAIEAGEYRSKSDG